MWKNIFRSNKATKAKVADPINTKPVLITLEIDENNKFNVNLVVNDKSLDLAEDLGLFLFLINEGYYVQAFLDSLMDLAKKNHNDALFAQTVISHWSNKIIENDKNETDEPIIKPSQFGVVK